MMTEYGWEVWYGDGTVRTDRDGDWDTIPDENVQAVVVLHKPPYAMVTYGEDTYTLPGRSTVKYGRWMPDEEWEAMRLRLHEYLAAR